MFVTIHTPKVPTHRSIKKLHHRLHIPSKLKRRLKKRGPGECFHLCPHLAELVLKEFGDVTGVIVEGGGQCHTA